MERTFGEKFSGIRKAIACLASGNALREVLSDEIYYINGSESLPPPLSAEEETEAIARLAKGDDNARSELIEHNLRLVVYIARKFENTGINIEDLISIDRTDKGCQYVPCGQEYKTCHLRFKVYRK